MEYYPSITVRQQAHGIDLSCNSKGLAGTQTNRTYLIRDICTRDEELKSFLFTLGCYPGEAVTVLSVLGEHFVITVKDARYSIDKDLAEAIHVCEA